MILLAASILFGSGCSAGSSVYKKYSYDFYNNYDGINNAKTINDKAGIEPVAVDKELIDIAAENMTAVLKNLGGATDK